MKAEWLLKRALKKDSVLSLRLWRLFNMGKDVADVQIEAKTPVSLACRTNKPKVLHALVEMGADVCEALSDTATRDLFQNHACLDKTGLLMEELVMYAQEETNLVLETPCPLVTRALAAGNQKAAQILLDNGVDVNTASDKGETELHRAIRDNRDKDVPFLLDNGADVNMASNDGKASLGHVVCRQTCPQMNMRLASVLLDKGADVNAADVNGLTPTHMAVQYNPEMVDLLLEHNADLSRVDKNGQSALHFAAKEEDVELMEKLVEQGANPELLDNDQMDAIDVLHFAQRNSFTQQAKRVASHRQGITVYAKNLILCNSQEHE